MATAPGLFHSLLRMIEHECCARGLSFVRVPDDLQWQKLTRVLDALDLTSLELVESKGPN